MQITCILSDDASILVRSIKRRTTVKGDAPKQRYSDVESAGQSFASENFAYNAYSFEAGGHALIGRGGVGRSAWPRSIAGHPLSFESTPPNWAGRGSRVRGRYGTEAPKRRSSASYIERARQPAYSALLGRQASASPDPLIAAGVHSSGGLRMDNPSLDFNVGHGNLSRVPSDVSIETRETAQFQVFVKFKSETHTLNPKL